MIRPCWKRCVRQRLRPRRVRGYGVGLSAHVSEGFLGLGGFGQQRRLFRFGFIAGQPGQIPFEGGDIAHAELLVGQIGKSGDQRQALLALLHPP